MMQRSYNLPNPKQIFRDPNYNAQGPKISQRDMDELMNRRDSFAPPPPPQQVQKFEEINNPKIFQFQTLSNDIQAIRAKLIEIEKRMEFFTKSSCSATTSAPSSYATSNDFYK